MAKGQLRSNKEKGIGDMAEIWERLARERRWGIVEKNPDDKK
jgi:ATP-dependent RNA circularization protein (DNA/RNA ligase family)